MKKYSDIVCCSVLLLCPVVLFSQETVTGLHGNAVAESYYSVAHFSKKNAAAADTIELPFLDDFSDSFVEPDKSLWSDNFAFINSTFPVDPPTVGVATLDALDYNGSHYPGAGSSAYQADYLSSQPVNLNYLPGDSLYLSFFYQPGGLAEPPETGDSLILDFYSPVSEKWNKIWSVPGTNSPGIFKRVMIKIDEPAYLQKGFRFRFRNYASHLTNPDLFDKRANIDHWHLDYVRLGQNRSISDTVLRDVAFVEPVKSILKDYTSLPWPHFEAAYNTQRAAFIEVLIQNNDSISRNIGTLLEIRDLFNTKPVYKVPVLNNDIASGDSILYKYSYNYPFSFSSADSAGFEIRTILQTDLFDYKANDTLRFIQKFYDYYALDDGTAEASYGMRGAGTKDVSSALKFTSFEKDTLRAIDIYFVQVVDSLNLDYYFYLNAWNDSGGKPGSKIVNQLGMRPEYGSKLNSFARYYLENPVPVEGTFYIGFTQTVEKLMNVGLDLNRPNKPRIFNNLNNGEWNATTILPGTPMMRPVLRQNKITGRNEMKTNLLVNAFPSPADEFITISFPDSYIPSTIALLELFDISGRLVRTVNPSREEVLPTADLQNGIYFLRLSDPAIREISTLKIIIQH